MSKKTEDDKTGVKVGEVIDVPKFRPLVRYKRRDETRVFNVLVVPDGAELWAVTEAPGRVPRSVKEGLFTNADEALAFLEEVRRTLLACGWREI